MFNVTYRYAGKVYPSCITVVARDEFEAVEAAYAVLVGYPEVLNAWRVQ